MSAIDLFEEACALCLEGKPAQAVETLRAGIMDGLWWSPSLLDGDPDLAGLRGQIEYPDMRRICESRFGSEQAAARPRLLVISPATTPWEPKTLFVIHWWGDTASSFVGPWRRLVDEGWTLVVPQSSQMCCSGSYCWDDTARALAELRQHLEDCARKRGLGLEGMVLAGASQGAPLALELAHEVGAPWLCVVPSFPSGYDVSPLLGVPRRARGAFLLGEQDPANARARPVMEALRGAGIPWFQTILEGVGHELPDELAVRVAEILRELRSATEGEDA